MQFLAVLSTLLALGGSVLASPTPQNDNLHRRQNIITGVNGISAPTEGETISTTSNFTFTYQPFDYCFEAFSGVSIWLVPGPNPPTASSLNATQGFSEYLAAYGDWIYDDDGISVLAPGPPPPSFSVPELDPSYVGSTVYVAVVENIFGCPPVGAPEYVLSSVGVVYAG
ncbi:hypothetical protein NM688_g2673 [Phlebia brevispora]|uniref:Uncharacterized protein n=1 Tax=Phlebia brevispora TaxID=194682 RepID=A0ACC1T8L4_9APHY|nr:hypothetical protein NM688_g2673 [Phlebia brevispora]